jgi:hypothetical protein
MSGKLHTRGSKTSLPAKVDEIASPVIFEIRHRYNLKTKSQHKVEEYIATEDFLMGVTQVTESLPHACDPIRQAEEASLRRL